MSLYCEDLCLQAKPSHVVIWGAPRTKALSLPTLRKAVNQEASPSTESSQSASPQPQLKIS